MLKKISKLSLVAWVVIIAAVSLFSTAGICAVLYKNSSALKSTIYVCLAGKKR